MDYKIYAGKKKKQKDLSILKNKDLNKWMLDLIPNYSDDMKLMSYDFELIYCPDDGDIYPFRMEKEEVLLALIEFLERKL